LNSYQNNIDGYKQWAATSRKWVEAKVCTRSADQIRNLEAASKAAFQAVKQQLDIMSERLQQFESGFERLENGVLSILNLLHTLKVAPAARANNDAPAAAAAAQDQGGNFFCFLFYQ
jgi:hypothetical protein